MPRYTAGDKVLAHVGSKVRKVTIIFIKEDLMIVSTVDRLLVEPTDYLVTTKDVIPFSKLYKLLYE